PRGAESGGVGSGGAEPGGAEPKGVEPGGATSEGAESGGAEPQGAASSGATGAGDAGAAGAGGAGVAAGASSAGGARTRACVSSFSPVRTARRAPCSRPPPVPGTHAMALRPSFFPLRVPLPAPPESSLPEVPDPESDRARAVSPTVSRLLATAVTDPSFESAAASALVAELLNFVAACRLDYITALVVESAPASPQSVGGECALSTDVLEDRQEDFESLAAAVPRFASIVLAPEGDPDAPDIPTILTPTPRSYAEAITGPYSSQSQAAMDAEMASWKSTCTYVDEVPPPGANIVDGMWIFRVKRPPGSPPTFKARYVARGFSQGQGVDYFQTFSPTPKMTTLRVLLHVAAQRDYDLRRQVYGLRQVPREWHDTLRTTLAALGFAPSTADPSLFLRTDTSLPPFYVLVYIDDLVFATADTEALILVKSELQKRHTCTNLGELRSNLGLQITRDRARRTITLTQSHMVHQVLQRFGFQFSSPQPTPLSTSHSLSAPPSDESVEPSGPYPELVGCLMYLMTCTRPDLAYPLSLLARYMAPGRHQKVHWDAAKRVLCYLCSTSGMGLVLGGRGPVVLTGHVDVSWVDDSATQRSSQGYTFSLGSGSVSWRSTRSSSVLSSSCEAEIYAEAVAAQELRWLTYLLTDLGEQPRSSPVLYVDNKAMIALCQEHKTKHIALRYFLARELQQRGQLRLAYVATRANTADVFTKALPHPRRLAELRRPTEQRRPAEERRIAEPRRPTEPHCLARTALAATAFSATIAASAATAAMASPIVLTFDAEGRAVDFDVWVVDLQLFLQCDSKDGVSLFDHTSGVSPAPAAIADSTVRSQWTTRDAVARLAVRSHLPSSERAHFGQYKTAKSLYDAVVARYSSPATAALSRLMLPYLFPDLAAFATVADLITHLRTSDARYHSALPTEFCAKSPPPMYITLYYLVTRLPDSLASVRDHFLSLCPIELTVDLLEERLTAAEKSILAEVGAAYAPSGRRRNSKGKGGKGSGGDGGGGGGGDVGGGGGGVGGGGGGRSGGFGGGGGGGGGSGSSGGGGGGGGAGRGGAAQRGGFGGSQR
ncbi:unnamed protein product, partial [Closterium sp. NIES-53]